MRRTVRILSAALAVASLAAPVAGAGAITFEFSGMASDSLGGGDLVDAPFLFTLTTDTAGVFQPFPNLPNIIVTQDTVLAFSIRGVGGTFAVLFHVFRNAFGPNSSVGLSPSTGDDLLSITDPSLATYDLKTPFGPLTQAPPDFINVGEAYATTVGDLIFTDDPDTSARFRASVASVPEPASIVMACTGALALLGCAWPRKAMGADRSTGR
jgi:hypothetical protein